MHVPQEASRWHYDVCSTTRLVKQAEGIPAKIKIFDFENDIKRV